MESTVIESDGRCACEVGPSLAVLNDVHKAYEEKMDLINRTAGSQKLQKQVQLLQSWVGDLVAQNTLLARTVEELEIELTSRVLSERRKFSEMVSELRVEVTSLRRRLSRKDSDLRGLLEVLRRLREFDYRALDSIHFNEVTQSDIFGPVTWTPTPEQGDSKGRKIAAKKQKNKIKNFMFLFFQKDKSKNVICDEVSELKIKIDSLQRDNLNKEREIRKLSKEVQQYEQTINSLRNDISMSKYHTPDVSRKDAAVTVEICCSANKECGDIEPVKEGGARDEHVQYQERIQHMESSGQNVRALREVNVSLSEEVQALHRVCAALDEQCRVSALRAQFKDEIIREMRRQLKWAKAKAGVSTSTPNRSHETNLLDTSDISIVERSTSPPLLITDESLNEDLTVEQETSDSPSVRSLAEVVARHKIIHTTDALRGKEVECVRCHCSGRQGSSGPSSIADSVSGADRTRCLQDKLNATLQILKNKEETVKVQAESLALAEARLSALAIRTQRANTHRGLQVQPIQKESGNGCEVEMTDVSITAHTQGVDENVVKTLKDKLSVVEDLYRECFYESAKQEQLIENLRGSYIQMRLMEKEKDSYLTCLQHVVDTQRSSAFAYQDIASEVDHLKTEISNFLNNSNNDSGMWERTEDCDITTDLRHIAEQLHRLQDLLTEDCSCGLNEENRILKRANEINERVIGELRDSISKLEDNLENKENSDQRFETVVAEKERELREIRNQLNDLENTSQRSCCCDQLSLQLQQVQGSLNDKTLEMVKMQRRYEEQNVTICQLRQELEQTKTIKEENVCLQQEVSKLRCEVSSWRSQHEAGSMRLRQLQKDLQRSQHRYRHLADHYKEISSFAHELQTQLKEAHTRGAKLCGEARHLVCAVRHSLKRQRNRQREQNERIKEQETIIQALQDSDTESALLTEPCCSKYLSSATSSKGDRKRSVSETASPPTPPRRIHNKTSADECHWFHPNIRSAGVQQPTRSSCGTGTDTPRPVRVCSLRNNGEVSPTEELLERVERAHEALSQAQRRWCQRAPK